MQTKKKQKKKRALDNQFFVAAISPARDAKSDYVAWGHSTAVDPWGKVIATTEHDEAIVYVDIGMGGRRSNLLFNLKYPN